MSSSEESDEEFESADEDMDFDERPETGHKSELKQDLGIDSLKTCDAIKADNFENNENKVKSNELLPKVCNETDIPSVESKDRQTNCEENESQRIETDFKSLDLKKKETVFRTDETIVEKSDEIESKEQKTVIKGRKLLRRADIIRDQTPNESEISEQKDIEVLNKTVLKTDETVLKTVNTISKIDETIVEKSDEIETKEQKTVIKGRKLLRKADIIRDQTPNESEISEQKKTEVLNKLSNLSEGNNSSKWNNWFSDIKSAAMTATSSTVSHVSQASNNWSFDPKSLLSSAATITTHVGTGISSVVENVSSVVDSAIGAPPPEQMAAIVKNTKIEPKDEMQNESGFDKQNVDTNESQNKSGFGFGLFDYTLNTLETIGKKTMEVIVDDDKKFDKRK